MDYIYALAICFAFVCLAGTFGMVHHVHSKLDAIKDILIPAMAAKDEYIQIINDDRLKLVREAEKFHIDALSVLKIAENTLKADNKIPVDSGKSDGSKPLPDCSKGQPPIQELDFNERKRKKTKVYLRPHITENMKTVGRMTPEQRKTRRKRLGMSQKQAADCAALSPATISRLETPGIKVSDRYSNSYDAVLTWSSYKKHHYVGRSNGKG